jgi:hypothetical protein
MIKCVCIDDKNRPSKIPESKWIKEGTEYTLAFAIVVLPQRQLAFQLQEIDLDESCSPFTYFLANRFAFNINDLAKLNEFVKECTNVNLSVKELMKETKISISE